ncbi:DUF5672 family protein [Spirosoma validum]|uniref:DUF5672 domain-containing protein n=1 Tax=Spirosoma validum TaxID=2771355 RepID=A0A927B0V2_9BACT|nr:DUF5672 family protein [Spirosoma validum]MBD2753316.1 hypothetical protein [Spirosoma validum]
MRCAIVIPVYKENLTKEEYASLKQIFIVLPKLKYFLICGDNFDSKNYELIIEAYKDVDYSIKRFRNKYFASINGYNELLLKPKFYKTFSEYDYILIYQLDAWIFRDELDYWCNLNYDYIGAPWFVGMEFATNSSVFLGIGNGGFSLRKVKSQIKVLETFHYLKPISYFFKKFKENKSIKSLLSIIANATFRNNTFYIFNNWDSQEDFFWGYIVSQQFTWYKIPSLDLAMRFSMEVNGSILYEMNDFNLPFGCHAWEKYNKEFWSQFIHI